MRRNFHKPAADRRAFNGKAVTSNEGTFRNEAGIRSDGVVFATVAESPQGRKYGLQLSVALVIEECEYSTA